jgi:hypothetical protein
MAEWPITTSEAARRLGIPVSTGHTIVIACEIPTQRIGQALCLDEDGFKQLQDKAIPFLARRKPRRKKKVTAS